MNYSKILTGFFLGIFFMANAQNDNSPETLLASGDLPGVTAKKLDPNTVVYSYSTTEPKRNTTEPKRNIESESDQTQISKAHKDDNYQYPTMRAEQGAVLPFEIVFNGSASSKEGIKAQEHYFKSLMTKPEQNRIIYQDMETTRERLNNAGIFDAQDLNYFDMPLIAKIVGAGVLVTAKIIVNNKKGDASSHETSVSSEEYNTKVIFKIYNKNGRPIFTKREAPFTATTKDSYHITLEHLMKQTPYYHKF